MQAQPNSQFEQFFVVDHPVIQHKLSQMRNETTPYHLFRQNMHELSNLLAYEACCDLKTESIEINTPLTKMMAPLLSHTPAVIIPILRAGLGMVDGFKQVLPTALVGHIGLYRDEETLEPQHYYFKIPQHSENLPYFICDPMLATGGTAVDAIDQLKSKGISNITFVGIIAAPEGVKHLTSHHPDVKIYVAALDQHLNEQSYIFPGLGDAGDRLYGTMNEMG